MRAKILLLLFVFIIAIPAVVAQDDNPELMVATGEITMDADGNIVVDGYIIAPAGSFAPGAYEEGDSVIITGYLLPDGETIQALSIEAVDVAAEEGTDELNAEATPEATSEATDGTEEVADNGRGFFCNNEGFYHPAGWNIAQEFDAEYDVVMTSFCDEHLGFGEIMLSYMMAEKTGLDVSLFLEARASGMGVGQIMKEYDIHANELFAGRGVGKVLWDEEGNFIGGRPDGVGGGHGRPTGVGGGKPVGVGSGRPDGVGGGKPDGVGGGKPDNPGGGHGGKH